uniref:Fatty acid desaturase domain-containing protein n=1 Tax=Chrysemys picta bellii TaxID=8478 RepID=A0A8C3HX84_CHRPI
LRPALGMWKTPVQDPLHFGFTNHIASYCFMLFVFPHAWCVVFSPYSFVHLQDAFVAFHINKTLMRKSMNLLLIGELAPGQPSFESCKNVKNFHELCATVKRMGLFKPSYLFFFLNFLQILMLEAAGWFTLCYIGTSFMPFLTAALLLTTAQLGLIDRGWFYRHDLGHLSVFTKSKWNHLCHEFVICNLKGLSSTWRNRQHNQHHAKTNCFPKDPDILLHHSLFALGKTLSVEGKKGEIPKCHSTCGTKI